MKVLWSWDGTFRIKRPNKSQVIDGLRLKGTKEVVVDIGFVTNDHVSDQWDLETFSEPEGFSEGSIPVILGEGFRSFSYYAPSL